MHVQAGGDVGRVSQRAIIAQAPNTSASPPANLDRIVLGARR